MEPTEHKKEMERLTNLILEEEREWAKVGMTTDNITPNLFQEQARVSTIIRYLIDNGIVSEDELNLKLKENVLEMMQGGKKTLPAYARASKDSRGYR